MMEWVVVLVDHLPSTENLRRMVKAILSLSPQYISFTRMHYVHCLQMLC